MIDIDIATEIAEADWLADDMLSNDADGYMPDEEEQTNG